MRTIPQNISHNALVALAALPCNKVKARSVGVGGYSNGIVFSFSSMDGAQPCPPPMMGGAPFQADGAHSDPCRLEPALVCGMVFWAYSLSGVGMLNPSPSTAWNSENSGLRFRLRLKSTSAARDKAAGLHRSVARSFDFTGNGAIQRPNIERPNSSGLLFQLCELKHKRKTHFHSRSNYRDANAAEQLCTSKRI